MDENRKQTVKIGKIETTGAPCEEYSPPPCSMTIFGASGDLAKRKLIPAIYSLFKTGILSERFFIIGASRTDLDDDGFRRLMEGALKTGPDFDHAEWERFAGRLFYKKMDAYDDPGSLRELKDLIEEKDREFGTGSNRIFYLATPPSAYAGIINGLSASNLARESGESDGWTRLVVEKPYGRDLKSALELNATVLRAFREDQVYRIDHYLGKETVQNIMMFRFANAIFEPVWNRRYIDHVQITAAESIGVEGRSGYYEQSGVLRDMFQNHMLQVLALIALEPPSVYESRLVSDERVKVLRALRPIDREKIHENLVLGQYVSGMASGKVIPGYREEKGVSPASNIPTFGAIKAYIDNWRWQGVPFYLRSGKRFPQRFSQVTIQFKQVPHLLFRETLANGIHPNRLVLRIQPDERLQMRIHAKSPGSRVCLRDVVMDFSYMENYQGIKLEDYERVLLDCMLGDKMLFVCSEGMELSWRFVTPLLEETEWAARPVEPYLYRAGTTGPIEAEEFIAKDNRQWINHG